MGGETAGGNRQLHSDTAIFQDRMSGFEIGASEPSFLAHSQFLALNIYLDRWESSQDVDNHFSDNCMKELTSLPIEYC